MRRLAVLGHPVDHSRSPAMQSAALAELGLDGAWTYEAIDVAPGDLESRVRAMAAVDFAGANVTIPHKAAALRLADSASAVAEEIGAANTLVFSKGRIEADNTDAGGLLAALPGRVPGGRALVLGAGGAARAAIWALARGGAAAGVERVDVWNRTAPKAATAAAELGAHAVASPEQGDYGLIVNTTAVGLRDEDPFDHLPLRPGEFGGQVVIDMVYGERPGRLLEVAAGEGAQTVDGIEVLVQQGALSLRIWTGREPPLGAMRSAARR